MMRCTTSFSKYLFFALSSLIFSNLALSQDYPDRTVKLVVPFAAGGGVDILTRVLADKFSNDLKQSFIVENRVGAGGNIGSDAVAKSKPDGYTLLVATTGTHAINPVLFPSLPFDAKDDFIPISLIAAVPNLLSGQIDSAFVNMPLALTHVKAGKLNALAITNSERSTLLPEVPTLAQGGISALKCA